MEFLDVVDENDNVIGKASKKEIYEKLLPHRIVHVLVFNDRDEMCLQLRSKYVSFCPLHWCTAVGGHVQSGETPEQAALREYEEEIGTTSDIVPFSKDLYVHAGVLKKFLITFKTKYNGPFRLNPKVVEKVEFFNLEEIQEMIDNGEKFHPELLFLLEKRFGIKLKKCGVDIKMDRKEIVKLLSSFKSKVNKKFPVTKMIFFGSRTGKRFHKDSDIDLIIVSPKFRGLNFFKRGSNMYKFWDYDIPVDFLCYTPEEFEKRRKQVSIVNEAEKKGIAI